MDSGVARFGCHDRRLAVRSLSSFAKLCLGVEDSSVLVSARRCCACHRTGTPRFLPWPPLRTTAVATRVLLPLSALSPHLVPIY
jgi:hypothetical protein